MGERILLHEASLSQDPRVHHGSWDYGPVVDGA